MSTIDLTNLSACVEDARRAVADEDPGPSDPTDYDNLLARLAAARKKLPRLYRRTVHQPFVDELHDLGADEFDEILRQDPNREGDGGLIVDVAHAILQNGEGYCELATDGFQEVASDLYDGFLSAEDRAGVKLPDRGVIAPLVKWGSPDSGPYTWPVDATSTVGARAAVVNLPPSHARGGLLGWSTLGHETAGHDILHADEGLEAELKRRVRKALSDAKMPARLTQYWAERIDETASDVMGMLNMGPAAAIGMIGYFRGFNAAIGAKAALSNKGDEDDPHPADILRGFLAAETVRLLKFTGAAAWAGVLLDETRKDAGTINLAGAKVAGDLAHDSAKTVAHTLVSAPLQSLEDHALGDIQNWRERDEDIVAGLRTTLKSKAKLPAKRARGTYAAHVVAAAVMEGLAKGANLVHLFPRMLDMLKTMHNENPAWGPLYLARPGLVARHVLRRRPR